ncbi:MAG TPA: D-glycero-beta-D-manno-heptose 1-phosphate adenylyltransferase [Acidobacteriota bacterium]|jgi:rfaE bifunctional protein nucleotidyltransferase chain/domain|nr:D-glycero-beta-D-manno-heptose 1-phosphate adenylyltransferase [Acidobacteriota bacterium]HNT16362.1 D-glycero-beta-D-manno-heptose 1-phosphate adenylyltransferase [Acidobacteriota bacterium]HPA26510.1 D-glycero-beta-D-manno-heptose 1-phosphate adenylyltransferase [Acidobacteriota bacterium]HQO19816.1 D-glycero-beta-D-manno-heptose 1-phosphate adenylyltransferase [Acidobacteriota bacterium]HQQ46645.1 D-glycero-beta-D-manno-heptose 1-phosphate adenylyltransferase [Acidobacteriota bacterium]
MGRILTLNEAVKWRERLKSEGKTLVFTNGCFDILHVGHTRYLFEARAMGDALMVGLNSDASTARLKGEGRPVYPEKERAEILCSLEAVDAVVIFGEDTPFSLISAVVPDVLVKGGDWKVDDIVGKDIVLAAGGRVTNISYQEGHSTTGILERIGKG